MPVSPFIGVYKFIVNVCCMGIHNLQNVIKSRTTASLPEHGEGSNNHHAENKNLKNNAKVSLKLLLLYITITDRNPGACQ